MSREEARRACMLILLAAALVCFLSIRYAFGDPLPTLDLREDQSENALAGEEQSSTFREKGPAPFSPFPKGPVNLNAASLEELTRLPGIGPVLAQRIVDYRQVYGKFSALEELKEVAGIGEKRFRELEDYLTVE